MRLKSKHAKFQRSNATGTFSNLGLNGEGRKMCIFNGKLATLQRRCRRDPAKVTINH